MTNKKISIQVFIYKMSYILSSHLTTSYRLLSSLHSKLHSQLVQFHDCKFHVLTEFTDHCPCTGRLHDVSTCKKKFLLIHPCINNSHHLPLDLIIIQFGGPNHHRLLITSHTFTVQTVFWSHA